MNCDECGDTIFVGSEYYHNKEQDCNYHIDCIGTDQDKLDTVVLRYREE